MNFTVARAFMGRCGAWVDAGRRLLGRVTAALAVLSLVWATPALATNWTFDWATLGWAPGGPGSMPRLYTNVAGSGIDVRVTITSTSTTWLNGTPLLSNTPGQGNELTLQVDFGNLGTNPRVNLLFEFFATGTTTPAPVAIGGIAARDIDTGNYRDVVTVTAVNAAGTTINPDFISQYVATPNWATGAGGGTCTGCTTTNTVHATGGGIAETNQAGWAAFNFASTKVRSMNFMYSAGDGNGDNNPD